MAEQDWEYGDEDANLLVCGDNNDGQLGIEFEPPSYAPYACPKPERFPVDLRVFHGYRVTHVACGSSHTLVSIVGDRASHCLYAMGLNSSGQLGLGFGDQRDLLSPPPQSQATPRAVPLSRGKRVVHLACGNEFTLAVMAPIELPAVDENSGADSDADAGHVESESKATSASESKDAKTLPTTVPRSEARHTPPSRQRTSRRHALEQLYSWGANNEGQLGAGLDAPAMSLTPIRVTNVGVDGAGKGERVTTLACGASHVMAVTERCGSRRHKRNRKHRHGALLRRQRARAGVAGGDSKKSHAHVSLWGWGWNAFGQLGLGRCRAEEQRVREPVKVCGEGFSLCGRRIAALACGLGHTLIATTEDDERVDERWTAARERGEAFDPDTEYDAEMEHLGENGYESGGLGAKNQLFALQWLVPQKRQVWGFGRNNYGQLGVGYTTVAGEYGGLSFPTPVPTLSFEPAEADKVALLAMARDDDVSVASESMQSDAQSVESVKNPKLVTKEEAAMRARRARRNRPCGGGLVVLQFSCGAAHSLALIERDETVQEEEARRERADDRRRKGRNRKTSALARGGFDLGQAADLLGDMPDDSVRFGGSGDAGRRATTAAERAELKQAAEAAAVALPRRRVRVVMAFGHNDLGQCGVSEPEPKAAMRWKRTPKAEQYVTLPRPLWGLSISLSEPDSSVVSHEEQVLEASHEWLAPEQLCAGYFHSLCMMSDGTIFQWGRNNNNAFSTGVGKPYKNITCAPTQLVASGGDKGPQDVPVMLKRPEWRIATGANSAVHFAIFKPELALSSTSPGANPLPWVYNAAGGGHESTRCDEDSSSDESGDLRRRGSDGEWHFGGDGTDGTDGSGSGSSDEGGAEGDPDFDVWDGWQGLNLDELTTLETYGRGLWTTVERAALPSQEEAGLTGLSAFQQAQLRARSGKKPTGPVIEVAIKRLTGAEFVHPLSQYYDAATALGEWYDPSYPEDYNPNNPHAALAAQRVRPRALRQRMRAIADTLRSSVRAVARRFPEHRHALAEADRELTRKFRAKRERDELLAAGMVVDDAKESTAGGHRDTREGGAGRKAEAKEGAEEKSDAEEKEIAEEKDSTDGDEAGGFVSKSLMAAFDTEPLWERLVAYRSPFAAISFKRGHEGLPKLAIVSELQRKGGLRRAMDTLADPSQFSLSMRFLVLWDVARGMRALHEHKDGPIVHSQLRTSNVLVTSVGSPAVWRAKVGDWLLGPVLLEAGMRCKHDPRDMGFGRQLAYTAPELFPESRVFQAQVKREAELKQQKADMQRREEETRAALRAASINDDPAGDKDEVGKAGDAHSAATTGDPFDDRIAEATRKWRSGKLSREQYDVAVAAIEMDRESSKMMAQTSVKPGEPSTASDVYAYGVIVWETITQRVPWSNDISGEFPLKRIFHKIVTTDSRLPLGGDLGPATDYLGRPIPHFFRTLMQRCWATEPRDRPTFAEISHMFVVVGRWCDESEMELR